MCIRDRSFNENHSKVRNGLSVTCPFCVGTLYLDSSSDDVNVRRALNAARQMRLAPKI